METLESLLAEHPFFKELDPRYITLIADCASEASFKAGDFIFREGDPATHFWLIRQGKVSLEIFAPGRGPIMIETLSDGDVMGWSWIVEPYRKQYDGRALELTRTLVFDARCIRGKCETEPKLGYELFKRFAQIFGERLQATRMRLLDLYGVHS